MTLEVWFWLVMALWLVLGIWNGYAPVGPPGQPGFRAWGGNLLLFILLVILGWRAFGAPLK